MSKEISTENYSQTAIDKFNERQPEFDALDKFIGKSVTVEIRDLMKRIIVDGRCKKVDCVDIAYVHTSFTLIDGTIHDITHEVSTGSNLLSEEVAKLDLFLVYYTIKAIKFEAASEFLAWAEKTDKSIFKTLLNSAIYDPYEIRGADAYRGIFVAELDKYRETVKEILAEIA